jgi:hypothetical protein
MVTAEAALVIPVLLAVTLALSWAIAVGAAQVRLIDAAREGARLAARGESSGTVEAAVRRIGPSGTRAAVSVADGTVTVQVEAHVSPGLPLLGDLPGVWLESQAVAASEETVLP